MIRENREPITSPETVHQAPFFIPSNMFERHLAARNGKRGDRKPGQATNMHRWVSPEQAEPPESAPETLAYWKEIFDERTVSGNTPPENKNLTSHGPLLNMPIFGPDGEEIMTVVDKGGKLVTIYTEDPENVGRLIPTDLYRKDYLELIRNQPQMHKNKK
jgi:hypothetical protein